MRFGAIQGNFRDFRKGSEGILGILRGFGGIQGNFRDFQNSFERILGISN